MDLTLVLGEPFVKLRIQGLTFIGAWTSVSYWSNHKCSAICLLPLQVPLLVDDWRKLFSDDILSCLTDKVFPPLALLYLLPSFIFKPCGKNLPHTIWGFYIYFWNYFAWITALWKVLHVILCWKIRLCYTASFWAKTLFCDFKLSSCCLLSAGLQPYSLSGFYFYAWALDSVPAFLEHCFEVTALFVRCCLVLCFVSFSPLVDPTALFSGWTVVCRCCAGPFRLAVPTVEDSHLISVATNSPLDIPACGMPGVFSSRQASLTDHCILIGAPSVFWICHLFYLTVIFQTRLCCFGTRKLRSVLCWSVILHSLFQVNLLLFQFGLGAYRW